MKVVHKYLLPAQDEVKLEMPIGARVLHVGAQGKQLCLWALVNPKGKTRTRTFRIAGTGHEVGSASPTHLGTALMNNGAFVLHVFEVPA